MSDNDEIEIQSELARGEFDLRPGRSASTQRPLKLWITIAAVIIFVLGGLITVWVWAIGKITEPMAPPETNIKADEALSARPAADGGMERWQAEVVKKQEEEKKKAEDDKKRADEEARKQADVKPGAAAPSGPGSTGKKTSVPDSAEQVRARKLGGGVLVTSNVADASNIPGAAGSPSGSMSSQSPQEEEKPRRFPFPDESDAGSATTVPTASNPSRGDLNNLDGPTFAASRAYFGPNRKYLLRHGTYARCALYTEIVTEHPGYVDCRLTDPIYSADGSTVLAAAGARIEGVQQVEMKPGQTMAFTNWTDLEVTAGIRAHIASYGAGPMGAAGTKAWVDNHLADRYGGALMLTLFQDGIAGITARKQSSNGSGYTFNNTEQNVEGMAEKTLDYSINIPPTGTVLPGTVLTIVVTRDIDFSSVYINR